MLQKPVQSAGTDVAWTGLLYIVLVFQGAYLPISQVSTGLQLFLWNFTKIDIDPRIIAR